VSTVTAKKKAAKPRRPKKPHTKPDERIAIVARILDLIANHKHGTRKACEANGITASHFMQWVRDDFGGLRERYVDAREQYFEALADECLEIADDTSDDFEERTRSDGSTYVALRSEHVQRSALRISTRKWLCEVGAKPRTGYGKDKDEDDAETMSLAIAALERIATAKAAAPK